MRVMRSGLSPDTVEGRKVGQEDSQVAGREW